MGYSYNIEEILIQNDKVKKKKKQKLRKTIKYVIICKKISVQKGKSLKSLIKTSPYITTDKKV